MWNLKVGNPSWVFWRLPLLMLLKAQSVTKNVKLNQSLQMHCLSLSKHCKYSTLALTRFLFMFKCFILFALIQINNKSGCYDDSIMSLFDVCCAWFDFTLLAWPPNHHNIWTCRTSDEEKREFLTLSFFSLFLCSSSIRWRQQRWQDKLT